MNCKELMIGDKVLVKVLSQIPDTFAVHTWTAEDYLRDLLQVKPIELTAEILEKNGFRKHTKLSWIHKDTKFICPIFSERVTVSAFNVCIKIQYVHTLQHALRLCGLNDLADKFKIE